MHISHPHFQVSEMMWAAMALLGVLAMVAFEALGMRLLTGKW